LDSIERRIAVENLLNPLRIDLDLEATPVELEQHRRSSLAVLSKIMRTTARGVLQCSPM
jgi:hypothetical protein